MKQRILFKSKAIFLHLWHAMKQFTLPFSGLLAFVLIMSSTSLYGQKVEHYMENECDCYIYPGGNDSTKSYTPTHLEIDSAENAIRERMATKNPPNGMHDLVVLGLDNFERHYHGTINKSGHKELRIHGVNKSNTNEVWVTYYDLSTGKLYNFTMFGGY